MAQTEMQPYKIIESIAEGEIRYYPTVIMAKQQSANSCVWKAF